jgi:uncharacterized protein (DUF362 family)
MSKVIVARGSNSEARDRLDKDRYRVLLEKALLALSGKISLKEGVKKYIPSGVVGMKANCIARRFNSTPVALADALCDILAESGIEDNDLIIWERTNSELEGAGFKLNASSFGRRCFGTDSSGVGYSGNFYSSGEVSSLVSTTMTDIINHHINLTIIKDHSIAGLSAGLKNMYGSIHNPNKYHGNNCDPYAAHISNLEPVRTKNRLTVLDAVRVQYNGGPGYDSRYMDNYGGLILSDDTVAADRVALEILEFLRKKHGLAPLKETGRPVRYLETAMNLGLGMADMTGIDLAVLAIDDSGKVREGGLF